MNRREFLAFSAIGAIASPLAHGVNRSSRFKAPLGKAEHCIFIWLGGGMSQVDTFDPKQRGNPNANPKIPGSDYAPIKTAVRGVEYTEHLPRMANLADRITAVRSVHHSLGSEHALATNYVHTGRPISGSTIYPSIGSIVAQQRGARSEETPAYVLMGYPSVSRGAGFLGPKHNYISLLDTEKGPAGFSRVQPFAQDRTLRQQDLLATLRQNAPQSAVTEEYVEVQEEAFRLAGPSFMRHFELGKEPASLRERYGSEFGQRCLLSRRLVEAGVRFIEVSHNLNFINGAGWDTHNEGQLKQHVLIRDLDQSVSTLMEDLESKGLLDSTLIAIGTEFGRPSQFDGGGGRGHQSECFSMILAGGGLNHCGAYGESDELSAKPAVDPVSVPDFHATIHAAMGIDPSKDITDGSRPVPITDGGRPIARLFA